jgi:hypothetical protein
MGGLSLVSREVPMKPSYRTIVTGAATVVVLASAVALSPDSVLSFRDRVDEGRVALADDCGPVGCSIAYKTDDGGPPSRVVPAQ